MTRSIPNLLRRTLVLLGAAAGLLAADSALAQTVTLTGATGNSCSYNAISISPNGSVSVQCAGGTVDPPPPPPPGQAQFTLTGPATLAPNTAYTNGEIKVTRTDGSNGPTASVAFGYTIT